MLFSRFRRSDNFVSILAVTFPSLLAFLQGLDSTEIAGFTAMQAFLKDYGYYNTKLGKWAITPSTQLLITTMISVGAAIGSIIAGPLGTRYGQKIGLMVCAVSSLVGTIVQLVATNLGGLIPGRLLVGAGIGMATNFILVYQSEVSPRELRGVLLVTFSLMVAIGGFVGTCVNQGTHSLDSRWAYRIPLLTQLLCPTLFMALVWFLPQSPRFLVSRGRIDEAYAAHRTLYGSSPQAEIHREQEMKEIVAFVEYEKETQNSYTVLDCFRGTDRRRTLIAMGLMTCQNFAGRDFLNSYGTYFFSVAGVKNPFMISVILNMTTVVTVLVSFPLVRYFGRRKLLLPSIAFFTTSLFIFSIVGTAIPKSNSASKVLVAFMICYNVGYKLSLGILASMMISESASTRLRSQAQSIAVFTAWSEAIFWTAVLPYLINPTAANLGAKIGFMYGGFGIAIFIFVFFCVPEYIHRSLEEVDEMFMKKVPARKFATFQCTGRVGEEPRGEKIEEEDVEHIEINRTSKSP